MNVLLSAQFVMYNISEFIFILLLHLSAEDQINRF